MNPVFLKHREKIELADYDGSDLVYPGDKSQRGKSTKREEENANKNKKAPAKPVGKAGVKAAKPAAAQGKAENSHGKAVANSKTAINDNANANGNATSPNDKTNAKSLKDKGAGLKINTHDKPSHTDVGREVEKETKGGKASTARLPTNTSIINTQSNVITSSTHRSPSPKKQTLAGGHLRTVDFELAGEVLGQSFRSQINDYAMDLGVTGYVGRTNIGTIAGVFQGDSALVQEMKDFVQKGGKSNFKIDRCVFRNEKDIQKMSLQVFIKFVEVIKRDPVNNILTQKEEPKKEVKGSPLTSKKSPKK